MSNSITIIGRLGKDPEAIGGNGCRFTIADDIPSKEGGTNWHNCSLWNRADSFMKWMKKGKPVWVTGRVEYTKKDERTYTNIIVENWQFVNMGGKSDGYSDADLEEKFDLPPFQQPSPLPEVSLADDDIPF